MNIIDSLMERIKDTAETLEELTTKKPEKPSLFGKNKKEAPENKEVEELRIKLAGLQQELDKTLEGLHKHALSKETKHQEAPKNK